MSRGDAMAEGLEGLRIFRLAEALADEVWAEVLTWSPLLAASRPDAQIDDGTAGKRTDGEDCGVGATIERVHPDTRPKIASGATAPI